VPQHQEVTPQPRAAPVTPTAPAPPGTTSTATIHRQHSQAALDQVALGLLDGHARHRMHEGATEGRADEMADEMMAAVGRLMKRG